MAAGSPEQTFVCLLTFRHLAGGKISHLIQAACVSFKRFWHFVFVFSVGVRSCASRLTHVELLNAPEPEPGNAKCKEE